MTAIQNLSRKTPSRDIRDFFEGRMPSRRELLQGMAAVGMMPVLQPIISGPARAAGDDLQVFTWAGYEVPDLLGSYVDEHGVAPGFTFFSSQEEALQKVRSGFIVDTVHPCVTKVQKFFDAGLIEPLDTSRISPWDEVWPEFKELVGVKLDDGNTYLAPFDWGNTSYCYNTEKLGDHEESWTLLWDESLDGRIAMQDGIDSIGAGALSLGMDPYEMSEDGLQKVKEHLIEQRPRVRFYWESTTDYVNAMANGEIDVAVCWNDGAVALKEAGVPVKLANPKEGILAWVCGLVRMKGGEASDDLFYDYLNAMLASETGAWLIDNYGFGHSNMKAFDIVSQERLDELGLGDPAAMMKTAVFQRPSPTRDLWDTTWEDVKLGM